MTASVHIPEPFTAELADAGVPDLTYASAAVATARQLVTLAEWTTRIDKQARAALEAWLMTNLSGHAFTFRFSFDKDGHSITGRTEPFRFLRHAYDITVTADGGMTLTTQKFPEEIAAKIDIHYIASADAEPTCGNTTGSVSMNPDNVGCPRCHPERIKP